MKSSLALLMIGITLVHAEKHSVQYFNKEATGLPTFSQFGMAGHEQNVMNNSTVAKHRFTEGVQVGDDQTGATDAFRQEGYDEEDSLSLDLKAKELKEKELKAQELRAKELKAQELKAQELRAKELKAQELRAKELKEQELRAKELKAQELRAKELKAQELRAREFSPVCSPSRRRR